MSGFLAVVLVLGVLIFFHEFGHFIMARLLGIGAPTFSLGFGPRLAAFRWGKTEYRLSAFPLGGYVHLAGETAEEDAPEGFTQAELFSARPAWQRMVVVAAGPIFNLVLAWAILWALLWTWGDATLAPRISHVLEDSPAMAAGVQPGDIITGIDGEAVTTFDQVYQAVALSEGRAMTFTLEHDGSVRTVTITPKVIEDSVGFLHFTRSQIGVAPDPKSLLQLRYDAWTAIPAAVDKTWEMVRQVQDVLVRIVAGRNSVKNLGGPISIVALVTHQAAEGLYSVLITAAFISVNLGLLNLFPIPVLDGGHIFFLAIEAIRRKPVPERWQALSTRIGLGLLIGLMLLATVNDISRIDFGSLFKR
jgi:regulator of sigma E protease